jgi:N-acetylmuramoyl-L-alanine amidase
VTNEAAITFDGGGTVLSFTPAGRKLTFNGVLVWLNDALAERDGAWTLSAADRDGVVDVLLRPALVLADAGFTTVVIDPGHGGRETGAIGSRRVYEKKVVLDVARRLRRKLRATGVRVRLTRWGDYTLSRPTRIAKARRWDGDVFLSLHANSAGNRAAHGIETFVVPAAGFASTGGSTVPTDACRGNRHDGANLLLAYALQRRLLTHTGSVDRGIRRARFDVLREAPCPAVLVECGFISNRAEEERMLQPTHRDALATALALGIGDYFAQAMAARSPRAGSTP